MPSGLPVVSISHRPPGWGAPDSYAAWPWETLLPLPPLQLADASGPAQQQTEVRVCWDATHLYVRFDCADRDIWGIATARDAAIYDEEVVELFIAAGSDPPTRYCEFQVNPLNTRFDGMIDNPHEDRVHMRLDTSWDPPWQSWVQCDPSGWQVVMCIPWTTFGVQQPVGHWRLNLFRIDRGDAHYPSEQSTWSPTLRQPADFHVPSRFGVLEVRDAHHSV